MRLIYDLDAAIRAKLARMTPTHRGEAVRKAEKALARRVKRREVLTAIGASLDEAAVLEEWNREFPEIRFDEPTAVPIVFDERGRVRNPLPPRYAKIAEENRERAAFWAARQKVDAG